jgi:hypothetical protein
LCTQHRGDPRSTHPGPHVLRALQGREGAGDVPQVPQPRESPTRAGLASSSLTPRAWHTSVAYLTRYRGMGPEEAQAHVSSRRPQVCFFSNIMPTGCIDLRQVLCPARPNSCLSLLYVWWWRRRRRRGGGRRAGSSIGRTWRRSSRRMVAVAARRRRPVRPLPRWGRPRGRGGRAPDLGCG